MAISTLLDGRQLPPAVLWSATGVLTVAIAAVIVRARSRAERFSLFAVWARYIMSAHHTLTYKPLLAGLSANAVGSIAIVGLGLLTINKRHIFQRFFAPAGVVLALMIFSALLNGDVAGALTGGTKIGYFVVVTLAVYEALGKAKEGEVMPALLWSFSPLILLQLLSLATGTVKAGESDGSASYIGGYNHEAAFSVGLAACLLAACFTAFNRRLVGNVIILVTLAGIYLANYRTTIIAMAPLLFVNFALPSLRPVTPRQRNLIRFTAVFAVVLLIAFAALHLQERFADLGAVLGDDRPIIRDPKQFTFAEQRYLSGRPYIWSTYYWAWREGTDLQHLFGFGPDSWEQTFSLYAHNTLVSALYEIGLLGVAAMLFWWGSMAAFALKADPSRRLTLLAGHGSFFLLNMATMPHWMIEGNIFYGILCGLTLYHWRLAQRAQRARSAEAAAAAPIEVRPAAVSQPLS